MNDIEWLRKLITDQKAGPFTSREDMDTYEHRADMLAATLRNIAPAVQNLLESLDKWSRTSYGDDEESAIVAVLVDLTLVHDAIRAERERVSAEVWAQAVKE